MQRRQRGQKGERWEGEGGGGGRRTYYMSSHHITPIWDSKIKRSPSACLYGKVVFSMTGVGCLLPFPGSDYDDLYWMLGNCSQHEATHSTRHCALTCSPDASAPAPPSSATTPLAYRRRHGTSKATSKAKLQEPLHSFACGPPGHLTETSQATSKFRNRPFSRDNQSLTLWIWFWNACSPQ